MSKINYWEATENAVKFQENGLWGMKTPEGEVIIPAKYLQIERCRLFLYCLEENKSRKYYQDGKCAICDDLKSDNNFYENGKVGLKDDDGNVIFPAEYDKVYQYYESDIYYTLKDGEYHYYNVNKEEILTDVKPIEGSLIELEPFLIDARRDTKVVVTKQIVEKGYGPNTALVNGKWVNFDRFAKLEARDIIGKCEVIPIPKDAFYWYECEDAYDFRGYCAFAKGKNALIDCYNQISELGPSWLIITKVWVSDKTIFDIDDYKKFFSMFPNGEEKHTNFMNVGFGYDSNLQPDEVRVLQISYYVDRWPASEEMNWWKAIDECTLEETKIARQKLEDMIVEDGKEYGPEIEDMLRKENFGRSVGVYNRKTLSCKEEFEKIDYLIGEGLTIEDSLSELTRNLSPMGSYCEDVEDFPTTKDLSFIHSKIRFLIERGSDVNYIKYDKTSLDNVRWYIEQARKVNVIESKIQLLRKIEKTLLDNGAKSVSEMDEDYVFWKQRKGYLYQDGKFVEK